MGPRYAGARKTVRRRRPEAVDLSIPARRCRRVSPRMPASPGVGRDMRGVAEKLPCGAEHPTRGQLRVFDGDGRGCGVDAGALRAARAGSYTHLRAHETPEHLVCRLLLEKK